MNTTFPPPEAGPAWDIARLFPNQGYWGEADYLALDTNHFVEFIDGYIEVLPMPTLSHQEIIWYLNMLFRGHLSKLHLGRAVLAPYRLRLRPNLIREPDILVVLQEHAEWLQNKYAVGADLVLEIVSDDTDSRIRDYEQKRNDYEQAGIPEYWIVDPQMKEISVLTLKDGQYIEHGRFTPGQTATSILLDGFSVDVAATFAAGDK